MPAYPSEESFPVRRARVEMAVFDAMGPWAREQSRNQDGPWQRHRGYRDEPVIPTKPRNRAMPLPAAMRHLMGPPCV